jgi:hypothetical protein
MENTPTRLSPTAQTVLDSFLDTGSVISDRRHLYNETKALADALRAAVDQVVPDGPEPSANSDFHLMNWTKSLDQYYQRQQTRDQFLAIADELERYYDSLYA